jgi:hypothetical protein
MSHKIVTIKTRQRLGIPKEGLPSEKEALAWYREHFRQTKGEKMKGTFGFQYEQWSGLIKFEYESGPEFIHIHAPLPLDNTIPLDKEVITLAKELNVPDWAATALRLVLLVGNVPEEFELHFPNYLIAPLGSYRILIHPVEKLSLRKWREIGETMGLLPGKIDMWKVPSTLTSYSSKRKNKKEWLYWQTLLAYMNAIGERRQKGQKGKKGLLIETGQILKDRYGWKFPPDSYTVRRYLDRAEKRWHFPQFNQF